MRTSGRVPLSISEELDLKPFMNLMVALIPILLISAEFARISVIDIDVTENPRGVNPDGDRSRTSTVEKLSLTALITDSAITIGSSGGFLPSITYREFREYSSRDDGRSFKVEHIAGIPVVHPDTKKQAVKNLRYEMYLYATDSADNIIQAWYTKDSELLVDEKVNPVTRIFSGDTVYTATIPSKLLVVQDPADYIKQPLSACDVLKCNLIMVKNRFPNVKDSTSIIIASDNKVIYDKIIKIMDVAREADFPDISIAKLREI